MDHKGYNETGGSPHMMPAEHSRVGSPVLTPPIYPQMTQHMDQNQIYNQPTQGHPQQYPQHGQPAYMEKPQAQVTAAPAPAPAHAPGKIEYRTAIPIPSLSMSPAPVDCPMCHERKMTRVTPVPGNTTHAWAGILFCFTIIFAFVPYITNNTKDIQHYCGHCGAHLATWHKSGHIEVFAYA